ncbi:DNA topoisomerase [Halorubrum californiense DSM 19288]|uniref:Type 2 DNA topoisomerase 6 subunit B n=1 Tax=Halorubrum californiense DSM 19288 TaxID=1227465 RepID=M0EEI7_9EURY|nr:DNA topoisomerase [Halorubrum californiense DSM 19288]TKX70716.1 DNA topoisomerase VI subunit B [Halorubrum sp. GN11GM_10-3_MGM]
MTSFQSTIGDEEGIAEELAEGQREISIAEFFEKNKHMLGFDSGARGLVTAVKEAVDNALDATEEAGHLPDIYIEIEEVGDYYRLVIEDNGPGITKEQLPKVFGKLLYGSRFHAREQSLTPDQQLLVRRDGNVEYMPIGVLCDAYLPGDGDATAPVPDAIEVPSFNRETQEMSWQPVTHAIRHETDEHTYEIETQKGRTVEVTGNHSVFSVDSNGNTREVKAGKLESGDTLLSPRTLPSTDQTVEEINLLEHVDSGAFADRRVYVYGFDRETLEQLQTEKTVRRKPSDESDRKRTYYRYDGAEILKDSLDQNYLQKGYLPAETVLELGWEEKAADCEFKTYRVGGDETTLPVSLPADESLVEMLAYYVSEGHAGPRQVGFTFGSHESDLIEATEQAVQTIGGATTTAERERNSTRVKAFGSPLALFLKSACGDAAENKRVPGFVFDLDPDLQRRFIGALYEGDGSDSHPSNELSHTTRSETLARQLSTLWNMQGVLASTEVSEDNDGYGDSISTKYRTKVYGSDIDTVDALKSAESPRTQQYKRVPTALLDEVRVSDTDAETVPDTIPGLLMAAGIGSSRKHAETYASLIERALDGDRIEEPRYAHNLQEYGLIDDDGFATDTLESLWETITDLHGITDTDMCLLSVKSVSKTEPPEHVYDISVPGESGTDENFVVSNEGALSVKNSRGQQGIGISAAVLYSQLTSGQPAKITSRPKGQSRAQYFELIIDTDTNEPEISADEETTWDRPHGTRIELEMEANMRARQQLHGYVKHTAVVNPHARLELREPGLDEPLKFERATDELPAETNEIRPHPHGVELGTLIKMLEATESYSVSGFLQEEFTRVGKKTADSVIDNFRDVYYGRELSWSPPRAHGDRDVANAVSEAVANKGAEATTAFAEGVAETVGNNDRITRSELAEIVDTVAETVEDDTGKTFGGTVRENAVDAAWRAVTGGEGDGDDDAEGSDDEESPLVSDAYALVDEATSTRKDDEAVQAMAEALARRFADLDGDAFRITLDDLERLVADAASFVAEQRDATFGETARGNVVEAFWSRARTVPDASPKVKAIGGDRDAAADLLDAMRTTDILAPPTDCLAPITAELVEAGLRKEYDADFYAAATRDAEVHGGDPFIVEAGIAYGGEIPAEGSVELLRFANRVPLVYQRGACATTDVIKSIGWRNYGLDQPGGSGMPNGPAVISIHVASTNVPFTSESKDALANVPEIEDEIELAVREAARELKSFLNKRRSMQQRREKQDVLGRILPEMADKVSEVTGRPRPDIDGALARIMNNVSVEREVNGETVTLVVENHSDVNEELDITDIVSTEPTDLSDGTVVDMDGEWFVQWKPEVPSGDERELTYAVDGDPEFEVSVGGVETEKLTVND